MKFALRYEAVGGPRRYGFSQCVPIYGCTWRLVVLASWGVLALAGCGLTGPDKDPALAPGEGSVAPGIAAPHQDATPGDRLPGVGRAPSSPLQVAAVQRLEGARRLIEKGDFLRAVADLEKTLALDSTNPHTYFYLARAHRGLGNFAESLNFLEVAESLFGDDSASLAKVWVLKGDNLRDLGQRSQAQHSYQRASEIGRR